MAAAYAIYHGPEGITENSMKIHLSFKGLKQIGTKVHLITSIFATGVQKLGYSIPSEPFFDTVKVNLNNKVKSDDLLNILVKKGINVRFFLFSYLN